MELWTSQSNPGKQTVIVDPGARCITIEDSNRFRTRKRSIPLSEIVRVSIEYPGKRSNFVTWYYPRSRGGVLRSW